MAKLFLLASAYAAVLAASCGVEYRIGFAVAAAAASSNVVVSAAGVGVASAAMECGAGPDQPHCNEPGYEYDEDVDAPSEQQSRVEESNSKVDRPTNTSRESSATSASTTAPSSSTIRGSGSFPGPKFKNGDVIELYNADSADIQIVFPSIVRGREATTETGSGNVDYVYKVVKTTDGKEVNNLPEKFLHAYVPYSVGDEALCNIGEFKKSRPIIVRCTILSYGPAAVRGAMVLQGKYGVRVHETKANEEYVTTLPVWKLQRRYLASEGDVAAG